MSYTLKADRGRALGPKREGYGKPGCVCFGAVIKGGTPPWAVAPCSDAAAALSPCCSQGFLTLELPVPWGLPEEPPMGNSRLYWLPPQGGILLLDNAGELDALFADKISWRELIPKHW